MMVENTPDVEFAKLVICPFCGSLNLNVPWELKFDAAVQHVILVAICRDCNGDIVLEYVLHKVHGFPATPDKVAEVRSDKYKEESWEQIMCM